MGGQICSNSTFHLTNLCNVFIPRLNLISLTSRYLFNTLQFTQKVVKHSLRNFWLINVWSGRQEVWWAVWFYFYCAQFATFWTFEPNSIKYSYQKCQQLRYFYCRFQFAFENKFQTFTWIFEDSFEYSKVCLQSSCKNFVRDNILLCDWSIWIN